MKPTSSVPFIFQERLRRLGAAVALLAFVFSTGCHSKSDESSSLTVPGAREGQQPVLITTRGTHGSASEPWTIRVAEDGTLHVSRNRLYTHDTVSPMQWQARNGWCVFVENDARVWAYDGARNLWMLQVTREGSSTHGPVRFPCPVPPVVLEKMSPAARQAIK